LVACDAEAIASPAAPRLARALGNAPFEALSLWTQIEVVSKLTGESPMQLLGRVRRGGQVPLAESGVRTRTSTVGDLVISVGWVTAAPGPGHGNSRVIET
jgi:hypothetical protein